jgi:hypothetical protein
LLVLLRRRWRRQCRCLLLLWWWYEEGDGNKWFIYFCWYLWFSLLELTINNIMVVFLFRLKVIMPRKRRLRKSDGGDLEVHKQNVVSLD